MLRYLKPYFCLHFQICVVFSYLVQPIGTVYCHIKPYLILNTTEASFSPYAYRIPVKCSHGLSIGNNRALIDHWIFVPYFCEFRWFSFPSKLNVLSSPTSSLWYCRHPWGGLYWAKDNIFYNGWSNKNCFIFLPVWIWTFNLCGPDVPPTSEVPVVGTGGEAHGQSNHGYGWLKLHIHWIYYTRVFQLQNVGVLGFFLNETVSVCKDWLCCPEFSPQMTGTLVVDVEVTETVSMQLPDPPVPTTVKVAKSRRRNVTSI